MLPYFVLRSKTPKIVLALLALSVSAWASDPWDGPAFSASPEQLRQAASAIKAEKDMEVTILFSEERFNFDQAGRETHTRHQIYRIESEEGVKGWAETSGVWSPWYQAKPEIKARVISADGVEHWLDLKTLADVPVHDEDPDVYSDDRSYGGPLPAIAVGAIVEEEVVTRGTAVFFSGGTSVHALLAWTAPVAKTRIIISHADSVPLRYVLHLLPDAGVKKATESGVETITIENGPLPAYQDKTEQAPPDVFLYPEIEFATGSSWQQVAAEYARQADGKLRVADVQPLLARLNLKGVSRSEAIRKIVSALHKNVRYTGVEFGESSLIPQFPSETLKRKYGDCKDKAALLATMLRASGIPADLALLDSGPGLDVNPDLPGMGSFDHEIVYVPSSGSDPELWIDATADYSRVGYLPYMDYGRRVLIIDPNISGLTKIPELTAGQNVRLETREFTLLEYGPAKITEKNEENGPLEADYRSYYAGDSKEVRENGEKYVKGMYLAEKLTTIDKTDPADLEKPFLLTFVASGNRGYTELSNAVVAIRIESLFDRLPAYFTTEEDESEDSASKTNSKPRTVDWQITPFVTEWHYLIKAPAGFKIRALPPEKDESLGSARFTQKYSTNKNGDVEATLRFDSGKARLTVEEAKTLREAVLKASKSDAIVITFDQIGYALLSAGKVKEAIAAFEQLAAQHPKEALHKIQLAQVLLDAGLGERARALAKQATLLEPNSAQAFSTLASVMEHDLIGRSLKKGFDYDAALAAYRKARQLDPKDKEILLNLAGLLEFDADGLRYSPKAHLEEAATEIQELYKMDKDYGQRYQDNVLYDLWYAHKLPALTAYLATLPKSEIRKSFIVAVTAAQSGADAALQQSLSITSDNKERSRILTNAGQFLLRIRKYPEAAALFEAGARGQSNEAQLTRLAATVRKTKPTEEIKIDPADPRSVAPELFIGMFSADADWNKVRKMMSRKIEWLDPKKDDEDFHRSSLEMREISVSSALPLSVVIDMAVSNSQFSSEGDDTLGYKITWVTPGAQPSDVFVTREDGQYKLLEWSISSAKPPENLAWEVLGRLEQKDFVGARKWLDWAREKVHVNTGDDPLSGQVFPYFWTKGQEGDESAIRKAALVLLPSKNLTGQRLAAFIQERDNTRNELERMRLNLVLAYAYAAQEKWAELLSVAETLMQAAPDSLTAFDFAAHAYSALQKFDDWDREIQARLQKHPDDPDYIRSAALLAGYRGQFAKTRELYKGLMDRGKATGEDLNGYAWAALSVPGPIGQDSIEAAQRANDLTKSENFGILHTLACLDAETGKTTQARDLLLKAMDTDKEEEPGPEIWFGFGKIAEQYGEYDAARTMYKRMEKPKTVYPSSSYALAQQRLAVLSATSDAGSRNAGH